MQPDGRRCASSSAAPGALVGEIVGADGQDLHDILAQCVDETVRDVPHPERDGTQARQVAHFGLTRAVGISKNRGDDIGQELMAEARIVPRQLLEVSPGSWCDLVPESHRCFIA